MARIIVDETVCKGCSMCVNACPLKLIALCKEVLNAKGYHPARLMNPENALAARPAPPCAPTRPSL